MTKVTFTVYHYTEDFTHEDIGFDDEDWNSLTEDEKQEQIESYAQTVFEESVQFYTEIKD
jgi:hypothetical protein